MTFAATRPCEWCHRNLRLSFDSDPMTGKMVEVAALCDCPDARWRRAECVDCGVKVPRKHPTRLGRKRCPKHRRLEYNRQRRDSMRRVYQQDPERREQQKKRNRERERRKRRNNPAWAEMERRRGRHDYKVNREVRGLSYRPQLPDDVRALRDRVAYWLHRDGLTFKDIGEAFGFTDRAMAKAVRAEAARRTTGERREAA